MRGISKGECSTNVSCSDLSQRMSNECRWHNAQRLPAVRNDTNDTVSLPMILFQLISLWYASFWFESGLVFMFDIIEVNFGFMLVKGDRPVYSVRVLVADSISRCRRSPIPVWYAVLTFKNDWLVDIGCFVRYCS